MDQRGCDLMVACASAVCSKFRDIRMAFGQSDEFSFVLPKSCTLWKRRSSKLMSSFSSFFAASFVFLWPKFFPDSPLQEAPAFDARCICFPSDTILRDYLSWRQADTHINHLLNCCFWALVEKKGFSPADAQTKINGTSSAEKNEILFGVGLNYNDQPAQHRKGSFLYWSKEEMLENGKRERSRLVTHFGDIIQDAFWNEQDHLLQ